MCDIAYSFTSCYVTLVFLFLYIYILSHIHCVVVLSVYVFPPGLAVGLGIGALAEVAKKTIRHNGAEGNAL